MRIFIIHNHYQDKGGEDVVFAQETQLLREKFDVQTRTFQNRKGWRGLIQFLRYPWNSSVAKQIIQAVDSYRPDIVHVHNIHYAAGPLLFRGLHKRGIPVVFTLHNFRLLDPSASLFFRGSPYLPDLQAEFPWKSVKLRVLDNSWLKTFWTAFAYYIHKKLGTWANVDRYLTLSTFAKNMIRSTTLDIDPTRISIKPNFVQPLDCPSIPPSRQDFFVYIGRLSEEKGISSLLNAISASTIELKVFGDGPLRDEVQRYAANHTNITYGGFQDKVRLTHELLSCQALIVPSICYEGMPLNILEAFSIGTPVLASKLGILEEMVLEDVHGMHFHPNDPSSILSTIRRWTLLDEEDKARISQNCKKEFFDKYSAEKNVLLLESIYRDTIQNRKR